MLNMYQDKKKYIESGRDKVLVEIWVVKLVRDEYMKGDHTSHYTSEREGERVISVVLCISSLIWVLHRPLTVYLFKSAQKLKKLTTKSPVC